MWPSRLIRGVVKKKKKCWSNTQVWPVWFSNYNMCLSLCRFMNSWLFEQMFHSRHDTVLGQFTEITSKVINSNHGDPENACHPTLLAFETQNYEADILLSSVLPLGSWLTSKWSWRSQRGSGPNCQMKSVPGAISQSLTTSSAGTATLRAGKDCCSSPLLQRSRLRYRRHLASN